MHVYNLETSKNGIHLILAFLEQRVIMMIAKGNIIQIDDQDDAKIRTEMVFMIISSS